MMMALKTLVMMGVVALACIMGASAFVLPTSSVGFRGQPATIKARPASTSTSALKMACRPNAKKDKMKRNRDNMRKFTKGTARKKVLREERAEAAAEREAAYLAKLFTTGMDDWEVDDDIW